MVVPEAIDLGGGRQNCSVTIGQHFSGPLYKQARINQISSALLSDLGFSTVVHTAQGDTESSSPNWKQDLSSELAVEQDDFTSGVFSSSKYGPGIVQSDRETIGSLAPRTTSNCQHIAV